MVAAPYKVYIVYAIYIYKCTYIFVCCWASVYQQCLGITFKCYHYLSVLLFCCCFCCCYSLIFINISKAALVKCFISFRFVSFCFVYVYVRFVVVFVIVFFYYSNMQWVFLLLIIGVCSKIYLRFSPSFLSSFFFCFVFVFSFSIFAFFLLGFSFTLIYVFCFFFSSSSFIAMNCVLTTPRFGLRL